MILRSNVCFGLGVLVLVVRSFMVFFRCFLWVLGEVKRVWKVCFVIIVVE